MSQQLALTNEQRKELFERLAAGIDHAGLTLNEFIFATADLLKSTFWTSQAAGKEEEELTPIRERISSAIQGVVTVLDDNTDSIAEDMLVLSTIMLEAVNNIFVQSEETLPPTEE